MGPEHAIVATPGQHKNDPQAAYGTRDCRNTRPGTLGYTTGTEVHLVKPIFDHENL